MTHIRSIGCLILAAATTLAAPLSRADDADVVYEWNQLVQATTTVGGPLTPRNYAIMHIAMFDAVNSIEDRHRSFRLKVRAPNGASSEAAAAQAAHDVLVALIPASQGVYDAALEARLAGIPPGPAMLGRDAGARVASRILDWRANDGANGPRPPYVLPPLPGLWQETGQPAGFTQLSAMTPFALPSRTFFMPPRHPELSSDRYADDFQEVKDYGAAGSMVRSADQTRLARLFAGVITSTTSFAAWNNVARDVAQAHGLSLPEAARLFALLNVSMQDGLLISMSSKFAYGLWRPVTAIRQAETDLNPATLDDDAWSPLLSTPPYPTYAGNLACAGASAARTLQLVFGTDEVAFTVLWRGSGGNPDVLSPYAGFWQFAEDQADSRVFGGIHFRFDNDASQVVCPQVSEYVFDRFMRPKSG